MLHTAWWYDNGTESTISQLQWRWNSLRNGDRYALVNVTAPTPEVLDAEINKLLMTKPLANILVNR